MNENLYIKKEKYKNIVDKDIKIIEALKIMNNSNINLLIIVNGKKFVSLLSMGDIRRAILDGIDIKTNYIDAIFRKDILVASYKDNIDLIKAQMLKELIICMPVLDENRNLVDIYYWDELFLKENRLKKMDVDVVVMAGGKGTRLKPLTNIIPKPLIPIEDKPIIEIIIDNFMSYKVSNFFISVNYKAKMIEDYLKDKKSSICKLHYFQEDKPLGTIGSLYLIKEKLNKTFFVSNCDIIIDDDYFEILEYHRKNKNDITIVSAINHLTIPYGVLKTKKGGILDEVSEKPEFTFQINTGMYILEPTVLDRIPKNRFYHITDLIEDIKEIGKIGVFPIAEKSWYDIGEWKQYQMTLNNYNNSNC